MNCRNCNDRLGPHSDSWWYCPSCASQARKWFAVGFVAATVVWAVTDLIGRALWG